MDYIATKFLEAKIKIVFKSYWMNQWEKKNASLSLKHCDLSQKIPMPQIARGLEDLPYLEEKYHCTLPVLLSISFFSICCWPM